MSSADGKFCADPPQPRSATPSLSIRWTIGDVHDRGFAALRLSLLGAWKLFGEAAIYTVCVNTVPASQAAAKVGAVPQELEWKQVTQGDLPSCVLRRLDTGMAEGVAWKLAPARIHTHLHELALDNDCILWRRPDAMQHWLSSDSAFLIAEDVCCALGQFASDIKEPRNSGIVGLPPSFDYERALGGVLARRPVPLSSELDEQGLQAATLSHSGPCLVVPTKDVTICSPFHPGTPNLGRCGAHFVGLNTHHIPWDYFDRPANEWIDEHWERSHPVLERLVSGEFRDLQDERWFARKMHAGTGTILTTIP